MTARLFLLVFLLAGSLSACTPVLVRTTGEEGLQENPHHRTAGAVVEDRAIRTKVLVNMRSQEPQFRKARVDVDSYNGVVLLTGQVQSAALKDLATEITTQASTKIKRIHNELEVAGKTGFLSHTNDRWINNKVKIQLLANKSVPGSDIHVVCENGAVYLMGLVTQEEGDEAAAVTRNVAGVTKVVKVFEYIN